MHTSGGLPFVLLIQLLLVGIAVPGPLFLLPVFLGPVFLGPGGILALRDPDTVLGAAIGQVRIAHG